MQKQKQGLHKELRRVRQLHRGQLSDGQAAVGGGGGGGMDRAWGPFAGHTRVLAAQSRPRVMGATDQQQLTGGGLPAARKKKKRKSSFGSAGGAGGAAVSRPYDDGLQVRQAGFKRRWEGSLGGGSPSQYRAGRQQQRDATGFSPGHGRYQKHNPTRNFTPARQQGGGGNGGGGGGGGGGSRGGWVML